MGRVIYFADLFAGIGGFHCGLKKAITHSDILKKNKFELTAVSEIDSFAKNVYSLQYFKNNEEKEFFDINLFEEKLDVNTKIDILFSGFPCQPFSNAGSKKGFDDERGKLIFQVIKMVKKYRPKIILLENVKHLITHNNEETLKSIQEEFNKLDYVSTKEPVIMCPSELGIPQKRQRLFIPYVDAKYFDIEKNTYIENQNKKDLSTNKKIDDYLLTNAQVLEQEKKYNHNFFIKDKEFLKVLSAWKEFVNYFIHKKKVRIPVIWLDEMIFGEEVSNSKSKNKEWFKKYISSMQNFYKKHKNFIDKWVKKHDALNWKSRKHRKLEWQAGFNYKFEETFLQERQSGLRFKTPNVFPTLVATVQVPIINRENKWRKLTPFETSRLQSYDEDYIICNNVFQAYKQHGNSVNVKVVESVITNYLLDYMERIADCEQ